jgi:hemerythrin
MDQREHAAIAANTGNVELVKWDNKYNTGIDLFDNQHKELVVIINQLFQACLEGDKVIDSAFKDAMSRMVAYVKFHFGAEEKVLQRIKYPRFAEHKKRHDEMVRDILEAAKAYNEGKKFVPNQFVRTLRDWLFSHIAVEDSAYAVYIADLKKKGLLTDAQINEWGKTA